NKIAEYKRKWYSLDWKIKSFTQLMQHIGIKKNIVNFYYGLTSIDVHGMSGIGIIEENIMTWKVIPKYMCYIFIEQNISNLVYSLLERYDLMEDKEISDICTKIVNSMTFIND
ncbi:hypothetical protein P9690_002032, partial [Enterococcus faecalis]|nr:hypothetical protein [Enterococcus faecalis]EKR9262979.1 hypothetical protein [Enterococcus faecalis]